MNPGEPSCGWRLQGQSGDPWARMLGGAPETSIVVLRVQVTRDLPDGEVAVELEVARVAHGEPRATLSALGEALEGSACRRVRQWLRWGVGPIHLRTPLVLERAHQDEGTCVFMEALVVPVRARHVRELSEILDSHAGEDHGHEHVWRYAEELAERWRSCPAWRRRRRIPIRYVRARGRRGGLRRRARAIQAPPRPVLAHA